MKIFCLILLIILETPFYFKIRRAKYDIIRQTAIAIIMGLIALFAAGIYLLGQHLVHILSIS